MSDNTIGDQIDRNRELFTHDPFASPRPATAVPQPAVTRLCWRCKAFVAGVYCGRCGANQ